MVDTITGAVPRYTRRRRAEMRAAWVAARARNTLRRPLRLAAISGTVFTVTLMLLVLTPRSARRASQQIAPLSTHWRDTAALLVAVDTATRRLAVAESVLVGRRTLASRPTYAPPTDTFPAAVRVRRDSLAVAASELSRLLDRVENSPLPQSYRALGESRPLATDSRVRAMLDSLADVEREREEFGAGGGVDPIFVALTARATAIGRSIQTIAEARQNVIRDSLALLKPPAISAPVIVTVDTLGPLQRRDLLQAQRDSTRGALDAARRANVVTERQLREARAQANIVAPPIAILGASLVVGLTIGFAIALMIEVGRPRVSDLQEAERVTGERVLAVVRPREIPPERARRKADLRLPPLIDPTSDAYRLLASHASVSGPTRAIVMVAGDVPSVTATIAANIAAVSANEMRSTLLVDADLENQPVASVLRLPPASGVAAMLTGSIDLAATAIQTQVGRDRWVDVVPSGADRRGPISNREAETLRAAIVRSARHYELTVIVSPLERANDLRVVPSVLVCAHLAHSLVSTLRTAVAGLRDNGARVIGIVLWSAEAPSLDPPWIFENWFAGERPVNDAKLAEADR
jgi:hypothetical protein